MLLKHFNICERIVETNKTIYLTFSDNCFSNDPKDTGILVYEPSAPRTREPDMGLFNENIQLRSEELKDTLNINHELQFEIVNYGTDIVSIDDPNEEDCTQFLFHFCNVKEAFMWTG